MASMKEIIWAMDTLEEGVSAVLTNLHLPPLERRRVRCKGMGVGTLPCIVCLPILYPISMIPTHRDLVRRNAPRGPCRGRQGRCGLCPPLAFARGRAFRACDLRSSSLRLDRLRRHVGLRPRFRLPLRGGTAPARRLRASRIGSDQRDMVLPVVRRARSRSNHKRQNPDGDELEDQDQQSGVFGMGQR